ncbi:MAG: TylF/MycF/NovP-related O-methyltransferase [Terracidiphilus sp.]|jgi:O-methyltransferase
MTDLPANSVSTAPELLYLELLKRVLTRTIANERYLAMDAARFAPTKPIYRLMLPALRRVFRAKGLEIVRRYKADPARREAGTDYPPEAETMVGMKRLNNLQECVTDLLRNKIPGDLIETGVWRGGCAILMKGVLAAYGDTERTVWLADSFAGLPKPDTDHYPVDEGDTYWKMSDIMAVSLETVQENFLKYGLLDERVRFLKGWFKDTLPVAPIDRLCLARLDGDMYESTIQALENLYPKLSPGGYIIIDDYNLDRCRQAVDDFRRDRGIADKLRSIDGNGVFWQRSG